MGKAIWVNPIAARLGEGFQLGMLIRTPSKRVILICVCGWHQIDWKETKYWSDVESTQQRSRFGRTMTITEPCLNHELPRVELKNYHALRIFVFLHGLMVWNVMPRNVWNDIVSWQIRRLDNSTKYLPFASMTTTSRRRNWNQLENCQKYAHRLSWNACIFHELVDLAFFGLWTKLHELS